MSRLKSFFIRDWVVLLIAAFLLYANTLVNNYSLDDAYVTQKDNVTANGLSAIPKLLTSFYGEGKNGLQYEYRPLVKISFAIEHQFFGVHPGVSHFLNLLFYIFCLFLIYNFITLLLYPARNNIPLYVALVFACMPIHAEVVASIKNRDILLCFIFTFLACNTILRAHNSQNSSLAKYLLAVLYIVLALLSKLDALPYLLILPAMIFFRYRVSFGRLALLALVGVAAYALDRIFFITAIHGQQQLRPYFYFENPLFAQTDAGTRIVTAFNSLGFYVVQCILPLKQSCYYGANTISTFQMDVYGYIGVIATGAIIWLMIHGWRKNRELLIGVVMFTASISMYLNLAKPVVGIVGDRFTFFASLGFCIVIVFAFRDPLELQKKLKPLVRNGSITLLLIYGFMIFSRNRQWKTSETIIASDVKKYPTSAYLNYLDARNKLKMAEQRDTKLSNPDRRNLILDAKRELETSIAVTNDYPSSLQLLAHVLIFYEKNYAVALPYVNQALRLSRNTELIFYKGVCLEASKNDSSEYYLKEAIRLDSSSINAYRVLASHYNSRNEYDKTLDLLAYALQKGVNKEVVYSEFATTYLMKNDSAHAREYYEKILVLNPNNQRAREFLQKR